MALDQGCNPDLRELGLSRGKSGEARKGGSHAVNSCCIFPGRGVCSQEAVQGLPPQDSPQPPPNSHVAPSGRAPGPFGPAQLPGSPVEARQLPPWAPAPHS